MVRVCESSKSVAIRNNVRKYRNALPEQRTGQWLILAAQVSARVQADPLQVRQEDVQTLCQLWCVVCAECSFACTRAACSVNNMLPNDYSQVCPANQLLCNRQLQWPASDSNGSVGTDTYTHLHALLKIWLGILLPRVMHCIVTIPVNDFSWSADHDDKQRKCPVDRRRPTPCWAASNILYVN